MATSGFRPSERQVVLFNAQMGESTGMERRAGPGVADVRTGDSLVFI